MAVNMPRFSIRIALVLLVLIILNLFLFLRKHRQVPHVTKLSSDKPSVKLILAYTNIYGRKFNISTFGRVGYEIKMTPNPLKECDYSCQWTMDKRDYPKSDAVVFHLYNNLKHKDFTIGDLPRRSNRQQKWVLMAREPQAFYYPHQLKRLSDMFNLTMTFQTDSDVVIPYGGYWKLPLDSVTLKHNLKLDYLSGKDKMVAWLASNCKTSSRREEYVQQLQKYISVDVYGKCGNLTTNTQSANGFRDEIAKHYQFYIAFENSDCHDYISEKFWNSLRTGIIPIVRGQRNNYKKLAPPNSYIHVDSFLSPQRLAEHLHQVSRNFTLFHKYHKWRQQYDANYKFFTTNSQWMCDLCERVHNSPPKSIDVYEHFSEDTRCFTYLDHNGRDRDGEHVEDIS